MELEVASDIRDRALTVSLKGSQLYTLKPELVPQAKHVVS